MPSERPIVRHETYAAPTPGQEILDRTYCPTKEDEIEFLRESEGKMALLRANRPDLEIQLARTRPNEMGIVGVPKQYELPDTYDFNQRAQDVLSDPNVPPSGWSAVGRAPTISNDSWEGYASRSRASGSSGVRVSGQSG